MPARSWFKAGDADAERRLKTIIQILSSPPVRIVSKTEYTYEMHCGDQVESDGYKDSGPDETLFFEKKAGTGGP